MPRLMQAIAAAAMVSFCASCATVTRGTTEQIQIVSDPSGAEARTSMGFVCVTPCTLQVGRKDEFTVTVSKRVTSLLKFPSVPKSTLEAARHSPEMSWSGDWWALAADASTGAGLDHYPNPVEVDLVPLKPTRPMSPKPTPRAKGIPQG